MTRRKPRSLRPDEADLWRHVASTTTPLHPQAVDPPLERVSAAPAGPQPAPPHLPKNLTVGSATASAPAHDLAPDPAERVASQPVRLDRKLHARLKRGKLRPQGRIDLHGMTLSQAHAALIGFVTRSQLADKRLLLVITGKGRSGDDHGPIPLRRGVLRHQVPQWLGSPPLSSIVQQTVSAHQSHGGSGAYYVYLRRPR